MSGLFVSIAPFATLVGMLPSPSPLTWRQGFPVRFYYDVFRKRYSLLLPAARRVGTMPSKDVCSDILSVASVSNRFAVCSSKSCERTREAMLQCCAPV
jgi:hypothetical protein